jgi:hypothetical protein
MCSRRVGLRAEAREEHLVPALHDRVLARG